MDDSAAYVRKLREDGERQTVLQELGANPVKWLLDTTVLVDYSRGRQAAVQWLTQRVDGAPSRW